MDHVKEELFANIGEIQSSNAPWERFQSMCLGNLVWYASSIHQANLHGGFNPSEKYEFVSWDDDIPNIWKVIIQSCSKPPTRNSSKNNDWFDGFESV